MKLYVIRGLTLVWVIGTLYLSLSLFLRTDFDQLLLGQEHSPHTDLKRHEDPIFMRKEVVKQFKNIHQGAPLVIGRTTLSPLFDFPSGELVSRVVGERITSAAENRTGWNKYLKYSMVGNSLWPKDDQETNDRILNQLHIVRKDLTGKRLKKILVIPGYDLPAGQRRFIDHGCPVNQCALSSKNEDAATADMIMFDGYLSKPAYRRPHNQIWVLFMLESPYHTPPLSEYDGLVNWTATYRTDSTLVAPYEHYTYFANYSGRLPAEAPRDFAKTKTLHAAWFVSNCGGPNGRSKYVEQLQQFINVDIYGACGSLTCHRTNSDQCNTMLKEKYFFYLAFENSNCIDYITEKLFWNALKNDVVPVVMGARRSDYERLAPPESFIHVDDFASPRDLANFLLLLMTDHDKYNSYFRWKGSGEYIDTKYWCRLCAMLHEAHRTDHHSVFHHLDAWWRGPGVCADVSPTGPGYATWRSVTTSRNESAQSSANREQFYAWQPNTNSKSFPRNPFSETGNATLVTKSLLFNGELSSLVRRKTSTKLKTSRNIFPKNLRTRH